MKSLTNTIALVAGGTGGVGEGIVASLLAEDALVIVPVRNAAKADQLRTYLGDFSSGNLITIEGDLESWEGIHEMQKQILRRFHHLDLVVASLGGWWQGLPITSITFEAWQQILTNNLSSHFLAIKGYVPLLSPRTGCYVHINGFSAEQAFPMAGPVAMAAAAQKSLVHTLQAELRPTGIRVYELVLGPVNTRQRARQGLVNERWFSAEEVGTYLLELYLGKNEDKGKWLHRLMEPGAGS